MPINALGAGVHPLRISEVLIHGGVSQVSGDEHIWVVCPVCDEDQNLAEAGVAETTDPATITVYVCKNGCTPLAGVGHAPPIPLPDAGYVVGNFSFGNITASPLRMNVPGSDGRYRWTKPPRPGEEPPGSVFRPEDYQPKID